MAQTGVLKGLADVRFGSKADMCSAQADVRCSTPLADMCGATLFASESGNSALLKP